MIHYWAVIVIVRWIGFVARNEGIGWSDVVGWMVGWRDYFVWEDENLETRHGDIKKGMERMVVGKKGQVLDMLNNTGPGGVGRLVERKDSDMKESKLVRRAEGVHDPRKLAIYGIGFEDSSDSKHTLLYSI